jgi:hypothetical protein
MTSATALPEILHVVDTAKYSAHRPFRWGVLVVRDPRSADFDTSTDISAITSTTNSILIPVRHAQDIEIPSGDSGKSPLNVSVSCEPIEDEISTPAFDGMIDLPSGQLSIGDAYSEQLLALGRGRWRIVISLEPFQHAQVVDIRYEQA